MFFLFIFSLRLDSFIFLLSLLSPALFHTEGGWKSVCMCVRPPVVYHSPCEATVKLSVLSANFTTCVKLKAVMWKRCLPFFSLRRYCSLSPFPFLPTSTPFSSFFLSTSLFPSTTPPLAPLSHTPSVPSFY